jgi:CheY-like chemotaxis protein
MAMAKSGRRVLIVEDEWMIASVMCSALKDAGFEIVGPAPRTAEAMDLLASGTVDAAALDIRLDGAQSYPVAEELARRNIPFVFMSGYNERDLPDKFKGRPFLTKPVNHSQVVKAVSNLLG